MKILFASDSFKGSLSSEKIISLLSISAKKIWKDCEIIGFPIADGGEGTIEAIINVTGGNTKTITVHGPLMENIQASYGIFNGNSAIIEMAKASGLPLVPNNLKNPLNTTSYGTGELILDALNTGIRNITIAIGGSATNDCGIGAMRALGIKFYDSENNELTGVGKDLIKITKIDISNLHPAIKESNITVMCDVNNPLTGSNGATYTFGKQKGGTPEILNQLELGMKHYANLMKEYGLDVENIPGAGAAGGLGAALYSYLNANLKSGIETILDLIDFDKHLEGVDLVITGEGRMDWQSAYGKVPSGVGMRCKSNGIPCIALVGGLEENSKNIYDYGICSIMPITSKPMDLNEAISNAENLYLDSSERLFKIIDAGMKICSKKCINKF